MLDDVIGAYLESIEEREFDEPFMALLRVHGYYDLHFLHGPFEFGKDFIAKRVTNGVVEQCSFQTKAGNLALREWREERGQIDDMRTTVLAHPSFDEGLPKVVVLVTTGRMVGQAAVNAQQYKPYVAKHHSESFELWDRESLIELMRLAPEVGLGRESGQVILGALASIDNRSVRDVDIERFSLRWIQTFNAQERLWTTAIECAVICHRLRRTDRLDLACITALCFVRAAWAGVHGNETASREAMSFADIGRRLFMHYAQDIWRLCDTAHLEPDKFFRVSGEVASFLTYHVRCCRLIEILGLLGLILCRDLPDEANRIVDFLAAFVSRQPGAGHPISDRWAVSLVPPSILLSRRHPSVVDQLFRVVVRWVGDHYDNGLGLANLDATPDEEIACLLGGPLEHVKVSRRADSFIASVVLDLTAILEQSEVYELAMNDFLAVGANPEIHIVTDTSNQYLRNGQDFIREVSPAYSETWQPKDGWKVAPHHQEALPFWLERIGRPWDLLAISTVLRDRVFLSAVRTLVAGNCTPTALGSSQVAR